MKRVLKFGLWGLGILVVLVLGVLGYFAIRYSPEFVRRSIVLGDADVNDYQRFPERTMSAAPEPFHFGEPDDPDAAEANVRAAFEADPMVSGNLEDFLASLGTQAFIVIQDDTVLYERYFNGAQRDSIVTSFSTAKSFDSTMVGIAIEDGLIASIDDRITNYLPELAVRDPRFSDITIRHLLNMSSGIKYVETSFLNGDDALTYYFPDLRSLALNETYIEEAPGQHWLYNNFHPLLIGMILERTVGMHVADYLEAEIWQPLGMEYDGSWSLDSEATAFEKMESGINARAIDFAKLGRLYLNGGAWDGTQIVPQAWVDAATRIDQTVDRAGYYPDWMNPPFGQVYHQRLWWGVQQDDGAYGFSAMGNHGQYIFVWPETNLIVVRNGERYGLDSGFEWLRWFAQSAQRLGS
ncbi:MAG: serine hydrolase [Anaerolineae bacterium]|nr:serine hydrolase [Anaerolineae bacterium]